MRVFVLGLVAASVNFGTAVSAIGRLVLVLLFLWVVLRKPQLSHPTTKTEPWFQRWDIAIIVAIFYMGLTVMWSTVDPVNALWAWSEHARLLSIAAVALLVRHLWEARLMLRIVVACQLIVVLSSWFLVLEVPVPWAIADHPSRDFEVFVSYLEQSIAETIIAFIVWHQRSWIFGHRGKFIAMAVSIMVFVHVVGFLPSRTGYLIALTLLIATFLLQVPRRWLWMAAIALALVATTAIWQTQALVSSATKISGDLPMQRGQRDRQISTDVRLAFWSTSLQLIAERPVWGSGAGSWNHEYLAHTAVDIPGYRNIRDPHQMFLLWAVEAGLVGCGLLCVALGSMGMYSKRLPIPDGRSVQAVLIALVVAGLTTSTIYGIGMGDFFCVTLGILLGMGKAQLAHHNGDS